MEAAQSRCLEPKPVANVVETDGMGKLGKKHGSQVAQDAEGSADMAVGYRHLEKLIGGENVPVPKGESDTEGWERVY